MDHSPRARKRRPAEVGATECGEIQRGLGSGGGNDTTTTGDPTAGTDPDSGGGTREGKTGRREPGSGSMRRSTVGGRRCARSPLTGRTSLTPRSLPRSGDAHCSPGRHRRGPQGRDRMIRHPGHIRLGDPHPASQLVGGGTAVERLSDRGRPDTAKRGTLPARRPHQGVGECRPFDRVGHLQYIVTGHGDRWLRAREVLATPRATVIPTQQRARRSTFAPSTVSTQMQPRVRGFSVSVCTRVPISCRWRPRTTTRPARRTSGRRQS